MIIKIDFNSDEAIYMQITNQIIMGIAKRQICDGDQLPSIRNMADEIGINMHTVNKAYTVLRQEGYKHAYLYPENLLLSPSFVYRQDGTNELSLISKILSSISLFYQNSKQRLQNFTISVYLL